MLHKECLKADLDLGIHRKTWQSSTGNVSYMYFTKVVFRRKNQNVARPLSTFLDFWCRAWNNFVWKFYSYQNHFTHGKPHSRLSENKSLQAGKKYIQLRNHMLHFPGACLLLFTPQCHRTCVAPCCHPCPLSPEHNLHPNYQPCELFLSKINEACPNKIVYDIKQSRF